MRSTYIFLSVAAPLASAFVIPDERVLADIVPETRATNDRSSKAGGEINGISPDEHRGRGRYGDWRDDDGYPSHGDWPGYDEDPHGRWPGHRDDDEDRHHPPHPGHGECRDDNDHDIHRPIDACPGPLCHADKTTWELIKSNEHTSRLAELLTDDKDLVDILNSTEANHTFFALRNHALEGLPRRNGPNPKFMSSLLRYHILPGRLSIEHIVSHGTLPTKLIEPALESRLPQRIVVREHHNGVMLNRRSRVVAADMVSKTQPWNISCMMRMGRRHIRMKVCITMYVLTGLPENQKRHNPHNNQSAAPTPRDTDNATSSTS